MKVFLILFIILPFFSFAQMNEDDIQLVLLSDNIQAANLFAKVEGEYNRTYFYADNIHTEAIKYISITRNEFCLNKSCQPITSPIYFFNFDYKNEFDFIFRLEDNTLCIIAVIDNKIHSIEILPTKTRTHTIYANRNIY